MNPRLILFRIRPVAFVAAALVLGSLGLSSTARPASAQDVLDRGVTGAETAYLSQPFRDLVHHMCEE
jgi:hypothetical protein